MNTKRIRSFKTLVLGTVLLFASCQKESVEEDVTDEVTTSNGKLIEKYFDGDLVTVKDMGNGEYLYHDDIILSEEHVSDTPQIANQKLTLLDPVRKWPNNTVVFALSSNLSLKLRTNILLAMKRWSRKTNIKFKKRTNELFGYVTFTQSSDVCSTCGEASIGFNLGGGIIKLGHNVGANLVTHEIGHTLGFLHEQARPERDNYIVIKWENIQSGKEDQFEIKNSRRLTRAFDINSIMMYHQYAFSKNGKPTITLLNGEGYTGAQRTISPLDIIGTNLEYPKR
ncbi:M12 family metallopeptidase [Aquimarina spinulae]|uniref:M12 family metallopeptidase n=1 Tax=Aquimarina spinulae TaxID=1192023 RepID=UPI000D55A97A|nr:M12 family metallopeptidase [Aquimarina spinulae]